MPKIMFKQRLRKRWQANQFPFRGQRLTDVRLNTDTEVAQGSMKPYSKDYGVVVAGVALGASVAAGVTMGGLAGAVWIGAGRSKAMSSDMVTNL